MVTHVGDILVYGRDNLKFSKTVLDIWRRKDEFMKEDNFSLDGRSKKMKVKQKQSEDKQNFEKDMKNEINSLAKKMKVGYSTLRNC